MDLAEERGLGMKTLKSIPEKLGLPLPKYTFEAPFLRPRRFLVVVGDRAPPTPRKQETPQKPRKFGGITRSDRLKNGYPAKNRDKVSRLRAPISSKTGIATQIPPFCRDWPER